MTVGVDPGVNHCGVGVIVDGELWHAMLVRRDVITPLAQSTIARVISVVASYTGADCTVVVEVPQIYSAGSQKGDQNDLISLTLVAGGALALADEAGYRTKIVKPREWKGTVNADTMTERIRERLSEAELVCLPGRAHCPPSLLHNVLDGIGIALHHEGRLERKRVYAF